MGRALAALLALALLPVAASAQAPSNPRIAYDRDSLQLDGKRLVLNSGEVHYSRMPDPAQWADVLHRMRAAGLNAISIYIPWGYHVPAAGRARWDGRYDLERFLGLARDAGLYVVARHGPYVQGEMDAGGYPPWATARPGQFRTEDPRWTELWKGWNAEVLPRVARWELGGARKGTVIALQIENEYPGDGLGSASYMRDQYADARRLGVTVPILHNDQQLLGTNPAPGRYADIVDLYGFDNYPYQFKCCAPWTSATFSQVDDFERRYRAYATRSPLYVPEIQGGMAPIAGDDGASLAQRYERMLGYATVQQLSLLGQGVTMINQYMFFGGTTWGYTLFPNLGSSYDYAAPIREWTGLGPRFEEQRRLGLMIAAAGESLAATRRDDGAVTSDDPQRLYSVRRSTVDRGLHVFLRNADDGDRAPRLRVGEHTTVPVPLPERSARYLVAGITLGGWKIDWTTAEVALARPGLLVLFGDRGKRYEAKVDGERIAFTPGKARVIARGSGRIMLLDRFAAARLWPRGKDVLVGPSLVARGRVVVDRDTNIATLRGGVLRRRRVAGPPEPAAVKLPSLSGWRFRAETPERLPDYDDGGWRKADVEAAELQYRPLTSPVLFADVYEQPTGYVWYRGRFAGPAAGVCLEGRHRFHVWLNGRSLGTHTSAGEAPGVGGLGGLGAFPLLSDPRQIRFPADALRSDGENVISVLTDDWGHTMDAVAANQAKHPRGLLSAALDRAGAGAACGTTPTGETIQAFGVRGATFPAVPGLPGGIDWRLRGGRPEDYPNASGLHGEREGWHRAEFDDTAWAGVALPHAGLGAGEVGWYRTRFAFKTPKTINVPLGLELGKAGAPGELFLNGVHVARAGRDREERFVLMPGLLRTDGRPNVLAYARWAVDGTGGAMPAPRLVAYSTERRVTAAQLRAPSVRRPRAGAR